MNGNMLNNREMLFLSILNFTNFGAQGPQGRVSTATVPYEKLVAAREFEYVFPLFSNSGFGCDLGRPLFFFFPGMTMMTAQDPAPAERQWLKITLLCPLPLLDSATDLMGVLSGAGVEQSPETESGALISGFFQLGEKTSDPHLQTESADNILARVEEQMTELFALYGCVPEKPAVTLLADQDWATSWQQYFKPFEIVPGLVIKPSWETYPHEPGQHVIEMDPGMAFGTGQHASTRMALALIKQSMAGNHP